MSRHLGQQEIDSFEGADRSRRERMLAHARECGVCRQALCADEPSRLFSTLHAAPVPQEVLEGVSRAVARRIERTAAPVRLGSRLATWAAYAAALTLAVLLAVAPASRRPTSDLGPAGSGLLDLAAVPAVEGGGQASFVVDLVSSPGTAQVLDFSVGETQVVMIFDAGIKL